MAAEPPPDYGDPAPYHGGSGDVNIEMQMMNGADAHRPLSLYPSDASAGSQDSGLRRRTSSKVDPNIMARLPSHQLANRMTQAMHSETWRKKSRKRRPGVGTLRFRNQEATEIANELLKDEDWMDGELHQQDDDIRDLAVTMKSKRNIKKQVERSRASKSKKPSWFKRVKYNFALAWRKFKVKVAEALYSLELWRGPLKTIEGNFGTGVTSYFIFLKWLFLMNIPLFLLLMGFVVIPQIMYRWLQKDPNGYTGHGKDFTGEELLTGGGWFEGTELYYGGYINEIINIIANTKYDMTYAYILTVAAFYILTFVVVALSLSMSYRKNYIESSGGVGFFCVNKVLCGWDFNITSEDTASLKHKSVFKELQEYLSGYHKNEKERTCTQWCSLFIFRIVTNLVVIGLLAGCGFLVWYLSITQSLDTESKFWSEMALPLCISGINFILPFAFSILASFESYHKPRTELYITMIRTITLNIVTLGVLLYFWFTSVDCEKVDTDDTEWLDSEHDCRVCWEDFMGQEIYKLVIMDFIFVLVITFFSEFIRKLMALCCCHALGYPEFNIGRNTLALIYSQILVWLGTYYSPLISCIMIFKLFIIFYVKKVSVLQNCVPSVKPWRAGRTHTIIMGLLFISFILCFGAVGYSVVFITPSRECGPYTDHNSTMDVLTGLLDKWSANENVDWLKWIIQNITSAACLAFIFLMLCVFAHFSRIKANGYKKMAELLRHQIQLEGKDKVFLIQLMQRAHQAVTSYGPGGYDTGPSSMGTMYQDQPETPISPGGKMFARVAMEKPMGGGQHIQPHSGLSQGSTPQSTTQRVHPHSAPSQGSTPQSTGHRHRVTPISTPQSQNPHDSGALAYNPTYSDKSPTTKPNLPYPAAQYS